MRRPSIPILLCLAIAGAQPAHATSSSTTANVTILDTLTIGASQGLLIGGTNISTGQAVFAPIPVSATGAQFTSAIASQIRTGNGRGRSDLSYRAMSDAARAASGIVQQVDGQNPVQHANFIIVGDSNRSVSISVPRSIALQRLGGVEAVQFDAETSLDQDQPGQRRLAATSDGAGALAFDVGGRVRLARNAIAGDYAGILRVTVQYN